VLEAPEGRFLGNLPGGERNRRLTVLAPGETFLFCGGYDLSIDDQRRRRVVEDGVYAKYSQDLASPHYIRLGSPVVLPRLSPTPGEVTHL
jgi:hypothetical protein